MCCNTSKCGNSIYFWSIRAQFRRHLPQDPQLEADKAWENVIECVKEAGMGTEDIVKITAYLTDEGDYPYFANSRSKFLGDARPASTAILVKALVKKEWRFEIEAVAAKSV